VYGYKPTISRWPADYGLKMSHLRDTIGPLANCMDDIAFLDTLVTDQRHTEITNPKDIRIGIPNENFFENLDPLVQ
jgi:mandelamide amidase